jgi:Zn-dependent metalloprotease
MHRLVHPLMHRCGSPRECCFIAPPFLLDRLAKEGTTEQRQAALQTIATSASFRNKRSMLAKLVQTPGVDIRALGLAPEAEAENRAVYDVDHGGMNDLPGRLVRSEGDAAGDDDAVNEAYDGADATYTFYKEAYGRDSVDGSGLSLISCVHFGVGFDNAFWDGGEMVYGDGSNQLFIAGSLTKAIDVIGHELTHGVTQYTAGLEYRVQPGALNESFSDVFGSLVKQYSLGQSAEEADWLIGAGLLVPAIGGQALRSMSNPGTAFDGDPQPAHMDDYHDLPDNNDPRNDNGGVHINSGIPNRAFYLAATAIGGNAWEAAGQIWYQTLTERLEPTSDFGQAANATLEAAADLFGAGGTEEQAVEQAWKEVGVL